MIVDHVCFFDGEATIGTFQVESGWASTIAALVGYVCRIVRYTRAGYESDTTSLKKKHVKCTWQFASTLIRFYAGQVIKRLI